MISTVGKSGFRKSLYKKPAKKTITAIVKKEINKSQDWHFYQETLPAVLGSVPNSWVEVDICPKITEGDDVTNRTGREIKIGSILIEGTYGPGAIVSGADDPFNTMRIVVATFKGAVSATPLQSAGVDLHSAILKKSVGGNLLNKLYLDKYLACNVTESVASGYVPEIKTFKYYKKFKNPIVVNYSSSAGTYPDTKLFISMISDSVTVVNPGFFAGRYIIKFVA